MLRDVNMKSEKYFHDQGPPSEKWFPTSFTTFDGYF